MIAKELAAKVAKLEMMLRFGRVHPGMVPFVGAKLAIFKAALAAEVAK